MRLLFLTGTEKEIELNLPRVEGVKILASFEQKEHKPRNKINVVVQFQN